MGDMERCSKRFEIGAGSYVECIREAVHDGPHKSQTGTTWDCRGLWQRMSYAPDQLVPPPSPEGRESRTLSELLSASCSSSR